MATTLQKILRNTAGSRFFALLLAFVLCTALGCGLVGCASQDNSKEITELEDVSELIGELQPAEPSDAEDILEEPAEIPPVTNDVFEASTTFDFSMVPAYSGSATVVINDDEPFFRPEELSRESFEEYAPLDSLGRCGPAFALVGHETMPVGKRGNISDIKPTGWQTPNPRYEFIVGETLYNRTHLLAFHLTGENANVQNLITGTRTMNQVAMQPLENKVGNHIDATGAHVLMRVTPWFEGNNLVASGVLMEAQSVEDGGKGVRFCRWCYNVEPGVIIDYATGANWADGTNANETNTKKNASETNNEIAQSYVLNKRSHKFHYPSCRGVTTMSEKNKQEVVAKRSELTAQGYDPCGICSP